MKQTSISYIYAYLILAVLFAIKPAHAVIIDNEIVSRSGEFAQSFQFAGETQQLSVTTAYDSENPLTINTAYNSTRAETSIGAFSASGSLNKRFAGISLGNSFIIRDLVMTYTGTGVADTSLLGGVHVTYNSALGHGADSSYFDLSMAVNSDRRNLYLTGAGINSGGIYEENFSFILDQSFTLEVAAQMKVVNTATLSGDIYGEGFYSAFLGGSPVFILPDGYTVNSSDGSIVDNYFVGNLKSAAVPEPGAWMLLLAGFVGIPFSRLLSK